MEKYTQITSPKIDSNGNFIADSTNPVNNSSYLDKVPTPSEFFKSLRSYQKAPSSQDDIKEDIGFIDLLKEEGIPIRVTSTYRGGNSKSYHSKKDEHGNSMAIDIIPIDGDFDKLRNSIYNNPRITNWLRTHNIGILEEITPDVMSKTGATGKHFHVGPDKWAIRMSSMYINYDYVDASNKRAGKSGKQRLQYTKQYLMDNSGLDSTHAAALAGVWFAESRLDPHIKSKRDSGSGIAQWTGSRHQDFARIYRQLFGKTSPGITNTTLEEQIAVAMAEYQNRVNNWNDFLSRDTLQGATDSVLRGYENGGNRLASIADIDRIYTRNGSGSYKKLLSDRLSYAKQAL